MKRTLIIIILILLTGCEMNTEKKLTSASAEPALQSSASPKVENLKFEVSSFTITYEKSTDPKFPDEKYNGNGIITVTGDATLVKKPYQVLVKITKTSGGDKSSYDSSRTIIVNEGVGKFSTQDWNYGKDYVMDKPTYEIKVLGYIPFQVQEAQTK